MRLAVDARELEGTPTGVGRVLEGLLSAWPEDDRIVLIGRREIEPRFTLPVAWEVRPVAGPSWLPGTLWEQALLPRAVRAAGADALLCPAYGMPRGAPCPTAVGMHDCAFASIPETFGTRERWRRRAVARVAARRAEFLFMGSDFAAAEARTHLGVSPERLLVLPYGVEERFRPADAAVVAAVRERYELPEHPVLFPGSHLQRRTVPGLDAVIDAVSRERSGVELCRLGSRPDGPLGLESGRWLGYVFDEDLPALYTAATAVLYPSRYEGFGLPVLEALACGTPVLTTDVASLGEIYRDHAILLPTGDPAPWGRALGELLDHPDRHRETTVDAARWARGRSWDEPARRLRARLHGALGRS